MSDNNVIVLPAPVQARTPQAVESRRKPANRYASALTPNMRRRITEEACVRGCVQTAKEYNVTFGLVLELRIAAIDKLLRETREWMAELDRRAA